MYSVELVTRITLLGLAAAACLVAQKEHPPWEVRRERMMRLPEVYSRMGLKEGSTVADVGAGGGFFTVRLARAVGASGRVYAVDVSENALKRLRTAVKKEKLRNVTIVRGAPDDPKLTPGSIDAVLMVDAYHEMTKYREMLERMRAALKPGGRLVVIDIPADKTRKQPRAVQEREHVLDAGLAEQEIRTAGFEIMERDDRFVDPPDSETVLWLIVARPPPREP